MSKKAPSQFSTQGNLFCLDDNQSVTRFLRGLGLLFVLAGVFAFCLWLADFIRSVSDRQDTFTDSGRDIGVFWCCISQVRIQSVSYV